SDLEKFVVVNFEQVVYNCITVIIQAKFFDERWCVVVDIRAFLPAKDRIHSWKCTRRAYLSTCYFRFHCLNKQLAPAIGNKASVLGNEQHVVILPGKFLCDIEVL